MLQLVDFVVNTHRNSQMLLAFFGEIDSEYRKFLYFLGFLECKYFEFCYYDS